VKDEAGLEAAVSGVSLLEPGQERFGCLPQREESLGDGFQAVADLFGTPVLRFFHGLAGSIGEALMLGHQYDLRAVDEQFLLGGLQGEDIGHILIRDGVAVGFKVQESVDAANPQGHFGGVIIVKGQGLKGPSFLLHKEVQRGPTGVVMDMRVEFFSEPPLGRGP